jgi:signal transduction histidine kinase
MSVALMVAQEDKGTLQLHFKKQSLQKVLMDAKESLRGEMISKNLQGGMSHYEISLGPSCDRIGELICDGELLKQVFINLFRNGMKYSLPRHARQPMIVDVVGMRQTGVTILQVTNWGLGLPTDDLERIFNAFTRGSAHDRLKAIRGMGLGLYISRRIVAAHKGQLYCHHSTCTLDDPARRERWEGFETMFEVRLPQSLSEGTVNHDFAGHQ